MIPRVYRTTTDDSIASYDNTDINEGVGYVTFYGVNLSGSYALSRYGSYSQNPVVADIGTDQTDFTVTAEKDFDLQFNLPQILGGKATINPVFEITSSSNQASYWRIDAVFRHVDTSSNETTLAAISGAQVQINANLTKSALTTLQTTIPTTKFSNGESLRVTIIALGKLAGSGSQPVVYLYADGTARADTTNNQINPLNAGADLGFTNAQSLTVVLPYKIDV